MATFEDFEKIDIRLGKVIEAEAFPATRGFTNSIRCATLISETMEKEDPIMNKKDLVIEEMRMNDLVERARSFAEQVHAGQTRANKARSPFITHPEEVALLVKESGGSDEEIAASFLHDSIEDTPTTLSAIIERFGISVGTIVEGMTDPPEFNGLPTLARKTRQAERVRSKSNSVKRVKIADQTSNLRCVAVDPPVKWGKQKCLDYIEGARLVVLECQGVSEFLDAQFNNAYQAAIEAHR